MGDEIDEHLHYSKHIHTLTPAKCAIEAVEEYRGQPAPPTAPANTPTPLRVYTQVVTRSSQQGPLYEVVFGDEVIVARSKQPFLAACRVLHDRGLRGPIELWDHERAFPRMRGKIEAAATQEVDETGTPRFRRHRQHWRVGVKTAAIDQAATYLPAGNNTEI